MLLEILITMRLLAITYANASDAVGFEWHSAADFAFGVDGLKAGLSASINDDADIYNYYIRLLKTRFQLVLTYVTTAGDTTVTIGGGYFMAASDTSISAAKDKAAQTAISISAAATGDLTVGVGFGTGDFM